MLKGCDIVRDTKDIFLTPKAYKLLRRIEKGEAVTWGDIDGTEEGNCLSCFELVYVSRTKENLRITEAGRQVLLREAYDKQQTRKEHRHNWLIAVFSTVGGAVLSKPLWEAIEWLTAWLVRIL